MARSGRFRLKPELRDFVKWAESLGWELLSKPTGKNHWVLYHPRAGRVIVPSTTGDRRSLANAKRLIKRIEE